MSAQHKNTTKRIESIYEQVRVKKFPFSVEKAAIFTEGYKRHDGEPNVIRVAHAQAYLLDNISIWMFDGDLIAGSPCSRPMGVEADFWTHGVWLPEGIEALRGENEWLIDDETAEKMYELSDYWHKRIPEYQLYDLYDEDMWKWRHSGFQLPFNKNMEEAAGMGYAVNGMEILPEADIYNLDYKYILAKGLNAIIADCREELSKMTSMSIRSDEDIDRIYNLRAMIIINEAVIRWVERYAILAEEKAAACNEPVRREELLSIAETCRRIPGEPAQTFQDAITFQWFVFMMTACQTTAPIARADQYLYPYYKKDIEEGRIDDEKVLEYLQCYRLKMMQMKNTSGGSSRLKWQGQARWNNLTIGGVKPEDGSDASNQLTYLYLEAAMRLPTPLHTISLRVHPKTPEALMQKAIELVKTGIGFPAFLSDISYIENLMLKGVPLEKARDYHILGCIDVAGPEIWGHAFTLLVQALPLDTFLHNGDSRIQGPGYEGVGPNTGDVRKMSTFDEFLDKLLEHTKWYYERFAQDMLLRHLTCRRMLQDPFTISLYTDGPKVGKMGKYRDMPYKVGPSISVGVGAINYCQSVYVIKKLVYEEKKITMDELIKALDANWEGERNQGIYQMCRNVPQYGNDIAEVDDIVAMIYDRIVDTVTSIDSYRGVKFTAAAISITSHDPGGRIVGATPDGRYAGEVLADASASPIQGRDHNGPTAVMNSAAKIPAKKLQSLLLNQKMHPSALKTEEDCAKMSALIHGFLDNGGKQVQFNVVDNKVLEAAQRDPDQYRDLIVRVAGYSTYFTLLGKAMQDEIITRTAHETV